MLEAEADHPSHCPAPQVRVKGAPKVGSTGGFSALEAVKGTPGLRRRDPRPLRPMGLLDACHMRRSPGDCPQGLMFRMEVLSDKSIGTKVVRVGLLLAVLALGEHLG